MNIILFASPLDSQAVTEEIKPVVPDTGSILSTSTAVEVPPETVPDSESTFSQIRKTSFEIGLNIFYFSFTFSHCLSLIPRLLRDRNYALLLCIHPEFKNVRSLV